MKTLTKDQAKILKKYAALVDKLGRYPTNDEIASQAKVTSSTYRHHFGSREAMHTLAKEAHPEVFSKLFTSEEFTSKRLKGKLSVLKDVSSIIVTTAVSGQDLFLKAFTALKTWEQATGGVTIYQPLKDSAMSGQTSGIRVDFYDPHLQGELVLWSDFKLNNKVKLSDFKISAKQLNPHTGAERIADTSGLTVLASPKVRLTPLANMEGQPGYIVSGGAITLPDYNTDEYRSLRTAKLAESTHRLGGVFIRLLGRNKYTFTPFEFDPVDGHFTIENVRYNSDGTTQAAKVEYIDFGDLHIQELTDWRREQIFAQIDENSPRRVGLHDIFSGITINPFNTRKPEYRYLEYKENGEVSLLEDELKACGQMLLDISSKVQIVDVIDSNHHKFLEYWIAGGSYRLGDPRNIRFAHLLAAEWLSDPHKPILQTALKMAGIDLPSSVIFHKSYTSLKFKGVERSQHGHAGSSGKFMALSRLLVELGPANVFHTHKVEIIDKIWNGGTMSGIADRRPAYALQGPNKQANALIKGYSDGARELVHIFEPK